MFRASPIPPGPRLLPFVGLGIAMQRDLLGLLESTSRRWDGLVRLGSLGPTPAYLAIAPELVGQLLQRRWRDFVRDEVLLAAGTPVFGRGVLLATDELHLRLRRTMQPAFTRARLETLGEPIVEQVERHAERWSVLAERGETILMAERMARLTQEVFVRAMFDSDLGSRLDPLLARWSEVNHYITDRIVSPFHLPARWPTPANRRMRRAVAVIDAIVQPMIAERRRALKRGEDRGDLLSVLLAARDPESGEALDDALLRDQILMTFFAGFETTSTALTWVWILLGQHPDVEGRVHAELDEVLGGRLPTAKDVPDLRVLRQVFDETLRLYPSAFMLARQPAGEQELGGFSIAPGSVVFASPYVLHRDPRRWTDPERFDPERFAPGRVPERFSYLPFGAGPRLCIGKHLAILEAMLILATLMQQFRAHTMGGHDYRPQPLFTLHFEDGAPMRLERR